MNELQDVPPPPPIPGANERLILGGATFIDPLRQLQVFNEDEWEMFTLQWVHGFLLHKSGYHEVQQRGGSGDKGRDVVAWIDPSSASPRRWNNYQCKHYDHALYPTDVWTELGKLVFYTFRKDYTVPREYWLVSPQGAGNTLQDLIDSPESLKAGLIANWAKYCGSKITQGQTISLQGQLLSYVREFDFSIIRVVQPHVLVEQHAQTRYHTAVFGGTLKPRPAPTTPPPQVQQGETRYVEQMYEAFGDHLRVTVTSPADFQSVRSLRHFFDNARECFYWAESLKEFSRDSLPDDTYFFDLQEQVRQGVDITLYEDHPDGYVRMKETCKKAQDLQIDSNVLKLVLRSNDRIGVCHQLANDDTIRWVPND